MRRIVVLLILVPLGVIIIAFAVANRQGVTVSFDPFGGSTPAASLTLPLFALVIVLLIIGVVIGGSASWLRHGRWRRAARRLEREVKELNARLHAHHDAAAGPSIVPRQQEPPPRLKLQPPARS
ncbi:MAG TPA: lipopolysaccharide assembly protein LapA domain-containing protein [Xanthobacteraceae bacterium]|nr:lipopolysaccharide assembly protein LapA domain-containing protein [Xanthobacteraceae bacterium]